MANKAQIGEIRTWKDGQKYQKTVNGWVPVKQGNRGGAGQWDSPQQQTQSRQPQAQNSQFQEIDRSKINDISELYGKVPGLKNEDIDSHFDESYEHFKEELGSLEEDDVFSEALADTVDWVNKQGGKSFNDNNGKTKAGREYKIKQGAWNEDVPVKDLPYAKGDVSYLKEKFPEAKVSAYIDDENEDHEVAMDIPLKNGNKISLSFYDDGKATVDYTSRDGENWTRDVDIYDESFDEIIDDAGYYDSGEDDNNATSEGNGKQDSSQFQMIDPSTINDTSELYGKVSGLKDEEIDSYFDETYDYLKEEMSSSEEDDVFSEALADTVRWVNKQGRKASQEEGNQESQQLSYTPEQLSDYAKSASDEGLKRAASSGDEQMRVAAKKEIARRKNEGMEADTDNPFDKGSVQKSQKEERIFKGQIYEKVEGGWIKKK